MLVGGDRCTLMHGHSGGVVEAGVDVYWRYVGTFKLHLQARVCCSSWWWFPFCTSKLANYNNKIKKIGSTVKKKLKRLKTY